MQICQNFTQHTKSMQNDAQKRNLKKKHRCWVFLRHCLAWFRTPGYFYWPAAEPLADARGTLGFCAIRGTPVENHCSNWLAIGLLSRFFLAFSLVFSLVCKSAVECAACKNNLFSYGIKMYVAQAFYIAALRLLPVRLSVRLSSAAS